MQGPAVASLVCRQSISGRTLHVGRHDDAVQAAGKKVGFLLLDGGGRPDESPHGLISLRATKLVCDHVARVPIATLVCCKSIAAHPIDVRRHVDAVAPFSMVGSRNQLPFGLISIRASQSMSNHPARAAVAPLVRG